MAVKKLNLDLFTEQLASLSHFKYSDSDDNYKKIQLLKKVMSNVISTDLSSRQRECITLYYFQKKSQKEISELLNINQSTVSRNINNAKRNLRKALRYFVAYF